MTVFPGRNAHGTILWSPRIRGVENGGADERKLRTGLKKSPEAAKHSELKVKTVKL